MCDGFVLFAYSFPFYNFIFIAISRDFSGYFSRCPLADQLVLLHSQLNQLKKAPVCREGLNQMLLEL